MILPRQKRKEQENAKEKRRKVKGVNIKRLKGQQKRQQKGAVGNKKRKVEKHYSIRSIQFVYYF